ncbi:type IA DNA topoisomerase [Roseburia inulinivorans]|uniref:DNA topoisomerase n=1 Tax=Roseburia inulinivorans TaxID=360807 RepID=A0A412BH55_9FIRM|nr:type IA DNA topoisomerase [Roseburia inulinivorans]RGQ53736.1 DNA topoisomerase III [Roseburia inulinivorans]
MAKSLIITEKPSVAQEFARILGVSGRNDGYIENSDYVITWCVGHLVEMVYPEVYDEKYKKWKLEDLPFLPKEYKYDVIPAVSKQYDVVHKMLHREDIDTVYWAGDAGKEGQTIEENIRMYGGVREGMKELRVWIDSQTEEEIRRGIREAKPMSDYANLGKSGIMRTIEDYAMGINFSRAMSVKYGNLLNDAAGTRSYTAIAVGRVMTCVLGMVVIREREIRNFVETPFYRVVGSFTDANIEAEWKAVEGSKYFESPLLYKENGFKKQESAENLIAELSGKTAVVSSIERGTSRKKAPLLFNLAELQAECSKRFKISPDETLQVAQDLYEKKLTTYPRTDARVLSTAVAKEIGKNVSRLKGYEPVQAYVERIMKEGLHYNIAKTQYTDDSKITDHYAIIPTGQLTELRSLNELQRSVYDLIVRRFLSIFYPAAEYQTVKLVAAVGEEKLFAGAKALKVPGFLEIAGRRQDAEKESSKDENEETDSPGLLELADQLTEGQELPVNGYSLKEGSTKPPKRYTSGSMVLAMENAGQLIEDEELRAQIRGSGIGTSATRAEIIKKLVRIGYLHLNKKSQILSPEVLGEMVYEVVNMTVPALLNPKMTASWEKGLDGITRGTVIMEDYREKLEDFIRKETLNMVERNLTTQLVEQIQPLAGKDARGIAAKKKLGIACPVCGAELVTTPFGYGCSNYKKDGTGCKFSVGTIAGRDLSEEEFKDLITKGRTDVLEGFVAKSKKKFPASLVLEKDEEGRVNIAFDFSANEPQIVEGIKCPSCGGDIVATAYGFRCIHFDREKEDGCDFSVGKIAEKSLNVSQLTELITNGRTETIRGFKSKTGKKFDACLCMEKDENGKTVIKFDFEHVEAKKVKDVVCPLCGGEIVQTPFGFGCANYSKDDPESCRFSIGKMAEKSLTESQVRELLTNGRTGTIRGFKSKTGKKFDARVALNWDEAGKVTGLKFDFTDLEPVKVKDVKCPLCGGEIIQTPFGYGCANYSKDNQESCKFAIGTIAGVKLKEAQVKELLLRGRTEVIKGFIAKTGMMFDAPLKLTPEGQVTFDFPEKPKPVDTTLKCPKCGHFMKKSQWYYECECGFKVAHTVAKVELEEAVMQELFETGKTKKKITGFTSKAGNVFDTCLKFEDDRISFDFDNPGENVVLENAKPAESAQNQEKQTMFEA